MASDDRFYGHIDLFWCPHALFQRHHAGFSTLGVLQNACHHHIVASDSQPLSRKVVWQHKKVPAYALVQRRHHSQRIQGLIDAQKARGGTLDDRLHSGQLVAVSTCRHRHSHGIAIHALTKASRSQRKRAFSGDHLARARAHYLERPRECSMVFAASMRRTPS